MIKVLVSVSPDLKSSIAVRYAESLYGLIEMSLQSVHVVVPDSKGHGPGSGWVRKTWEKALMEAEREEIRRFLEFENAVRPMFSAPKILLGGRQEALLHELQNEGYDLFMEGVLPTFNHSDFYNLIRSRLYRQMPCAGALVVKNLVKPEKAALILCKGVDYAALISSFMKIFNKPVLELDVLYCRFGKSARPVFRKKEDADALLGQAEKLLIENNWPPATCREVESSAEDIAEQLRNYSLVVSAMERNPKRKSPLVELLGRVLSPVLICWK